MKKISLILRTLRYLRPVQILNRVWRKLPSAPASAGTAEPSRTKPAAAFPAYFRTWDYAEEFTFIGETHRLEFPNGWNDASLKKLWLYNLHYFDFLRQDIPQSECSAAQLTDTEIRMAKISIMLRWIDENPYGKGNGWEPYTLSLRIVNWIKFLSVTDVPDEKLTVILRSLALQTASLRKKLEYHLLANHLLANAKALVFAGKFFKGKVADKWYKKGLAIYRKELAEQVLDDGVHFERSAMYHSIIVEDVLDCLNYTGEKLFRDFAARMLSGLDLLTGPDGQIALVNDAAFGIALEPGVLRGYAEALSVTAAPTDANFSRPSGFVKLQNGDLALLAKCGEIGPSYQPGHAHADSLSFELWKGDRKIITDTGTDRYVIDPERLRQRSTAAHNTAVVNGRNSSEVWAGHRVARRAAAEILSKTETGFSAEHNGYSPVIHRRSLELDGALLRGCDEFFVRGKRSHETVDIEIRFHLAPGIAPDDISIVCDQCQAVFEPCEIAAGFGHTAKSQCAVLRFPSAKLPAKISWTLR